MTAEHHFIPFDFVPHVICLKAEPYFMPIDFRPQVSCLNPVIAEPY